MYFSRIMLNPLVNQQQVAQEFCQDSYREHQALWKLFDFDPDASRDFLFRRVNERGSIKYYLLSKRKPINNSGIWVFDQPKPYQPRLKIGQRLYFMLKANPIISISDDTGKSKRHDVVMHEKKRIGFNSLPKDERPPLSDLVRTSGKKWLQDRSQSNGFSINSEAVNIDGYYQHTLSVERKKHPIKYSTMEFEGLLTVTDPELFLAALYKGIGRSKAFGCGLMLIRRI